MRPGKEIEGLRGGVHAYAAQANQKIDAAKAEKDPFRMETSYTAKYTKIASGYMGQLLEWPEVVTEGRDIEECRAMLRDALKEMVASYEELGKEIPPGSNALIEQIPAEVRHVGQ